MSYLFYIDESATDKKLAILHPEVIKLCPSLSVLSSEELLYVVLYTDYHSPYKQFPDHERKRKAMQHAFDDNEYDLIESERIQIAIRDYTSLQYSPKIEAARQFQRKIDSLLLTLQEDTSATNIKKTVDAIDLLRKNIQVYEREYDEEVQKKGVLKGKMTLSLIEEMMANQKHFKSVTEKK